VGPKQRLGRALGDDCPVLRRTGVGAVDDRRGSPTTRCLFSEQGAGCSFEWQDGLSGDPLTPTATNKVEVQKTRLPVGHARLTVRPVSTWMAVPVLRHGHWEFRFRWNTDLQAWEQDPRACAVHHRWTGSWTQESFGELGGGRCVRQDDARSDLRNIKVSSGTEKTSPKPPKHRPKSTFRRAAQQSRRRFRKTPPHHPLPHDSDQRHRVRGALK